MRGTWPRRTSKGLLHRDLKPANIMLDGRGRVRITDFGLASLAGDVHGGDVRAGTPAYMAPEQLAGKEVTFKSDIYSLGLVLYEIFTGKRALRRADSARADQAARNFFADKSDHAGERSWIR